MHRNHSLHGCDWEFPVKLAFVLFIYFDLVGISLTHVHLEIINSLLYVCFSSHFMLVGWRILSSSSDESIALSGRRD